MNRRNFIRSAGTVTIGGMAVRGMGSPLLSALNNTIAEDRVLVSYEQIPEVYEAFGYTR